MKEGDKKNHDLLHDDVWSYLDWNDHQVEKGETESNKLVNPTRSDTCQPLTVINEMVKVSVDVVKKRSPPQQKKNGKEGIAEPNSGVDETKVRRASNHEVHKWTERERRKKMRTLFETLHALVPNLPAKTDKSKIVYEAANRIQQLQNTFNKLESQKLEREENNIRLMGSQKIGNSWEKYVGDQGSTCDSIAITPAIHGSSPLILTGFMTWSSPNVILNVSGEDAHISVCCPKKPGLFTTICYVLKKHKIDIVSAQISSDQFKNMFMIQAHTKGGSGVAQFSEGFTVEDMYKQAANEIMLMTTSK